MDHVVVARLFCWLTGACLATAQLPRSGLYLSVRNATGGPMCITDVPKSTTSVRSFMQCATLCRSLDCCVDFNIIEVGPVGLLNCQLFDYFPMSFGVQNNNCTAYQLQGLTSSYHITRTCDYSTLTMTCPENTRLCIQQANYGRLSETVCLPNYRANSNCRQPTTLGIVKNMCQGQTTCAIQLSLCPFGDPCPWTSKYLDVSYYCA